MLYEHDFLTVDESAWLAGFAAANDPRGSNPRSAR